MNYRYLHVRRHDHHVARVKAEHDVAIAEPAVRHERAVAGLERQLDWLVGVVDVVHQQRLAPQHDRHRGVAHVGHVIARAALVPDVELWTGGLELELAFGAALVTDVEQWPGGRGHVRSVGNVSESIRHAGHAGNVWSHGSVNSGNVRGSVNSGPPRPREPPSMRGETQQRHLREGRRVERRRLRRG